LNCQIVICKKEVKTPELFDSEKLIHQTPVENSRLSIEILKTIKSSQILLENMKNITSFTPLFEKDMYNSPLYGKEWNWRNIKMEARESHINLRS